MIIKRICFVLFLLNASSQSVQAEGNSERQIGSCIIMPKTNCVGADLRNADLRHANLSNANLARADLRGANLVRLIFVMLTSKGPIYAGQT